jgi:glucose/arabinose dehydrogenase
MKMKLTLALLMVASLISGALAAQQQIEGQAQPAAQAQDQPRAAKPQPEPREIESNVQVEVSISDYAGSAAPQRKTVSMVVASGNMGRVRAQRGGAAVLNVDSTPRLQKDGRIVLQFSLEYRPQEKADTVDAAPINELLTVLLQSGKPLVVTQAADPSSDRKVTVEVTATILK